MKRLLAFLLILLFFKFGFSQDCPGVRKEIDKFQNTTSYIADPVHFATFIKRINGKDTAYILSMHTKGTTANVGKQGLYIIFSDGKRIDRPETEVNLTLGEGAYYYYATIKLTKAELEILGTSFITDWRLYIYDGIALEDYSKRLTECIQCILSIKNL